MGLTIGMKSADLKELLKKASRQAGFEENTTIKMKHIEFALE
jgi:hypothetical protein